MASVQAASSQDALVALARQRANRTNTARYSRVRLAPS